jgi:hypothetical protein
MSDFSSYNRWSMAKTKDHDEPAKVGRPLRATEAATARIELRVTPDEKTEYQSAADAKGVTISVWIRDVLAKALKRAKT